MGELPPLHASEVKLYQACPRKWVYAYLLRRVSVNESIHLTRGKQVHQFLEDWWKGAYDLLPSDIISKACCIAYDAYWGSPTMGTWYTEVPWEEEIAGVACAGTLDALQRAFSTETIVEHKTTSQDISPGSMYWRQVVTTDVQVSMYRAAFPGATILYDVIRKPALRQKKDEHETDFLVRLIEAMAAKPEEYFQRATVVRLESEDEAFYADLVSVDRLRHGKEHPRNPSSCFNYGSRCEYFDVCWGSQSITDDSVFKDREIR